MLIAKEQHPKVGVEAPENPAFLKPHRMTYAMISAPDNNPPPGPLTMVHMES